jgi:hypothetical protein
MVVCVLLIAETKRSGVFLFILIENIGRTEGADATKSGHWPNQTSNDPHPPGKKSFQLSKTTSETFSSSHSPQWAAAAAAGPVQQEDDHSMSKVQRAMMS